MPATHTELRASVWTAISALPRPVSEEAALAVAKPLLPAKEYADFEKWLAKSGDAMLRRLNG